MATASAAFSARFGCSINAPTLSWKTSRIPSRNLVSMGTTMRTLISQRSSRIRVLCAAKPETVSKVMEIVKEQLAVSDDTDITPESKFTQFGADSLDMVEIVMALEEEFEITVEEDNSQKISTVHEAAELIDKLVEQKSGAA